MGRSGSLATAALLSLTVALAMLLAGLYIRAERTFYFADYNAYLDFTRPTSLPVAIRTLATMEAAVAAPGAEREPDAVTVTGRIRVADGDATTRVALQATCMDRGGVLVSGPASKATKVAAADENFALTLRGCAGAFLILDWHVTHRRPVAAPYRLQVDQLEVRPVAPSPRL